MSLETEAMLEIARFFASRPTPEQIVAFQASDAVNDRLYALIATEKADTITAEEQRELDIYEAIEHLMIHTKAEARRKIRQQAS